MRSSNQLDFLGYDIDLEKLCSGDDWINLITVMIKLAESVHLQVTHLIINRTILCLTIINRQLRVLCTSPSTVLFQGTRAE